MELIIDINKIIYDNIINPHVDYYPSEYARQILYEAVLNATPLPQGHGRLIDADALKKDDETVEWLSINPIRTGKMLNQFSKLFVKKIDDAPTIIEADKGDKE